VLCSVGANATHGQRRTNEDKRRAALKLLGDAEWSKWSGREIAKHCAVSRQTIANLRPADTVKNGQYEPRTFTHPRTGRGTVTNTASIGRREPRETAEPFVATGQFAPSPEPGRPAFNAFAQGDASIFKPMSLFSTAKEAAEPEYNHHGHTFASTRSTRQERPARRNAPRPRLRNRPITARLCSRFKSSGMGFSPQSADP